MKLHELLARCCHLVKLLPIPIRDRITVRCRSDDSVYFEVFFCDDYPTADGTLLEYYRPTGNLKFELAKEGQGYDWLIDNLNIDWDSEDWIITPDSLASCEQALNRMQEALKAVSRFTMKLRELLKLAGVLVRILPLYENIIVRPEPDDRVTDFCVWFSTGFSQYGVVCDYDSPDECARFETDKDGEICPALLEYERGDDVSIDWDGEAWIVAPDSLEACEQAFSCMQEDLKLVKEAQK